MTSERGEGQASEASVRSLANRLQGLLNEAAPLGVITLLGDDYVSLHWDDEDGQSRRLDVELNEGSRTWTVRKRL